MTLQSVLGCQVCSAHEKQSVPRNKVFFGAKCASASVKYEAKIHNGTKNIHIYPYYFLRDPKQ